MLGDFLFAQSSWFLANLNNLEVGLHLCGLNVACCLQCAQAMLI